MSVCMLHFEKLTACFLRFYNNYFFDKSFKKIKYVYDVLFLIIYQGYDKQTEDHKARKHLPDTE